MSRSLIGTKIRERRRASGVTQAHFAASLGISASYLNLIEANKRNIGGVLLKRIADSLELDVDELDGASERRLVADLREITAEQLLSSLRLDPGSAERLAAGHGDWARALVALHRSWLDRSHTVSALSDRLSQDPFLGDAVHDMLSRVAAIRSSSEILETIGDLEPEQRQRFVSIIGSESARLSDVAQALAAFFDQAHSATRSITPAEEVDDFVFDRDGHFPALERAAADFRAAAAIEGDTTESALVEYLQRTHSVQVSTRPAAEFDALGQGRRSSFDAAARVFAVADAMPRPTRRFAIARLAVELFHQGRPVADEIADAPLLSSDAARRRAQRALHSYLAGAVLFPYESFLEAAAQSRYDVDYLGQRFGASFEQVCHRLVTLRRPGASGIPFGFMRSDPAGFVTKRFPLPRLLMPRYGNACPLWAIYGAFQTPGAIVRQLAAFATGERFLFLARTVEKPRPAFSMPRRMNSVMLACDALHADRTVYGDGLDLSSAAPATPVGPNCRLCTRRECLYREEDPIIDA